MGLRHLFVVSSRPRIVGLLTRKDVIKENAKLVLGEKANKGLDDGGNIEGVQVCSAENQGSSFKYPA